MKSTPMQRRYQRFPRLMFGLRRLQRVNYEPEMRLLDLLCDRGATSVDVGAKLGMYSYRLLRHSRDVVAFEPIPILAGMLRRVFAGRRVRIEACALSDSAGRLTMRIPFGSDGEVKFGRSTIEDANPLEHDDVASVEQTEVDVKTLDELGLRGVGFIKIDVEGHELAVLRGARETLAREQPNLLVESNDHHRPGAVAALHALLGELGYRGYYRRARKLEPLVAQGSEALCREGIENFIFIPARREELRVELERRVAKL